MTSFPWKTVWIVGASSGLGAETARRLANGGCTVAVSARSADALEKMAAESYGDGGRMIAKPLDVTDPAACRRVLEEIEAEAGLPDLVVQCAGVYTPMSAKEFDLDGFRRHVEINLMGVAAIVDPVLEKFLERGRGKISIVASISGYRGLPLATAYGPTKAALINLVESLKTQLHGTGVDVQVINPGFVRTPLTDQNDFRMPNLMELEDAAEKMVKGLNSNRFEVTFPWQLTKKLRFAAMLPYWLYFRLIRGAIKQPD